MAYKANISGEEGFEPSNGETKTRCLTTWRLPNEKKPKNRFRII